MIKLTPEQRVAGQAAFADVTRRDFLKAGVAAGAVAGGGLGAFYFGYEKAVGSPVRVGVIGTGDEGSVLLGASIPNSSRSGDRRHSPLQPPPGLLRRLLQRCRAASPGPG